MRICVMSDNHGLLPKVPKCDVLLMAGDLLPNKFGPRNREVDALVQLEFLKNEFSNWLNDLKCKVIAVAGNHDFIFEHHHLIDFKLNWTYLENSSVEVDGIKVWGSPYSPWFFDWAFNAPRVNGEEFLKRLYNTIPEDTDIIISHGPPYGYGDFVSGGGNVGSKELLFAIERIKPRYTICGHIHEGYSKYKHGKTKIINASILDDNYIRKNKILSFEVNYPEPFCLQNEFGASRKEC